MGDFHALIAAVDRLTAEEKQQLLAYLQAQTETVTDKPAKRIAGLHEHLGHAWMSEDFDDELPDAFWLGET